MDWPVVDLDARRCSIRPGQRVLHPRDVESLGKLLAEVARQCASNVPFPSYFGVCAWSQAKTATPGASRDLEGSTIKKGRPKTTGRPE